MDEGMSTLKTNTAERQAAIRQQLAGVDLSTKDADTAFLLELVGGALGFLGIGYIYSGLTNAGILRLLGLWVGWAIFGIFATITFGLGACLAPLVWIGAIALAYFSANDLKQSLAAAKAASPMSSYTSTPSGYIGAGTTQVPQPPMTPTTPPETPVNRNPDDTF